MAGIQINQLDMWLNREIGKKLKQNTRTAQKLVQEGLAIIRDITNAIRKIEDYVTSELRKGSEQLVRTTKTRSEYKVARHLNKFSEAFQVMLKSLKVSDPQNPDYNTLRQFHDSSLQFARDAKTLFSKYRVILAAPWIRSRKEIKDLHSSLIAFGKKMAELKQFSDETFSLNREAEVFLRRSSQLRTQHQKLNEIIRELNELQKEEIVVLKRKRELESQIKVLQKDPNFQEWENIQRAKYELEQKIRKIIRPLKRALKKIETQADAVQEFFTPRAMEQIGNYLEDPYQAYIMDNNSPNVLIEVARGIKESIQTGKLVIDKSRGRKGIAAAERLIQNPRLVHNPIEAQRKLEADIEQFRSSSETAILFQEISGIEAQLKDVESKLQEIARRKKRIKTRMAKDQKLLAKQMNELENMGKKLTGEILKIDNI
ncbi:MAG: hypothetical protein ACE5R6_11430 [Candidatus Heimdallarchaeota archaeon]